MTAAIPAKTMTAHSRRRFLQSGLALCALGAVPQRLTFARPPSARDALLDFRGQPHFVEKLPNPLDPAFVFRPVEAGGSRYEIFAAPLSVRVGIVDPKTGKALETPMWGYGAAAQPPTYPGRYY